MPGLNSVRLGKFLDLLVIFNAKSEQPKKTKAGKKEQASDLRLLFSWSCYFRKWYGHQNPSISQFNIVPAQRKSELPPFFFLIRHDYMSENAFINKLCLLSLRMSKRNSQSVKFGSKNLSSFFFFKPIALRAISGKV